MKLLIADDERDIADAIGIILQYSGFDSDIAYDGKQALELAQKNVYDGIILDIMMPGLDGIQVLTRLRAEGDVTPILMLTAKAEVEDRIQGLEQGADDYLAKPFDKGELIARIKVMTRRKNTYDAEYLMLGNTRLNPEKLEISNGSSSLRLSGKEVEVLDCLLKHKEKIVKEDYLRQRLWTPEEYENGAEQLYIGYLKNKLQAIRSDLIITRENEGFCLKRR